MERKKNKQPKLHLKIGDQVMIIAGDGKGKSGSVMEIDFKKMRAFVEGQNLVKKHQKPSATNPNGEIIEIESSIDISNLMLIDPSSGKARRSGRKKDEAGKLQRYFKEHTSVKETK